MAAPLELTAGLGRIWAQSVLEESTDPAALARRLRARAALRTYLFNVLLGTILGLAYLADQPPAESLRVWLFAHLGLLSSVATLAALPGLATLLLARSRLSERALAHSVSALWMLAQLALLVDAYVFRLFGYHLNGSAWLLLSTRGSEDSFRLGPRVWIPAIVFASLLYLVQITVWRAARGPSALASDLARELRERWTTLALVAALASAVFVEKGIYAHADLERDRAVTTRSQAFPLYARFSLQPLLSEELRARYGEPVRVPVRHDQVPLAYPLSRPSFAPGAARADILVLVVDSWRADMLGTQVTPHLADFARRSRRFDDHLSGGNGTRFGVFSLVYGLHGSYWWPVLERRRPPVLVEALQELGYEFGVFSSASMEFPELRATAWSTVSAAVHDDFPGERQWRRDERAAQACIDWWRDLRARPAAGPRFTFVLLDSAHQPYDYPDGDAPFQPCAGELDYMELAASRDPDTALRVKNRYRNALRYADRLAGRILAELEASGELERTIVVVTGDHGEEFAENGFWGHTGNFSPEQVAVPFLLRAPGVEIGVEHRPTAHVDLACTLLELLGADPSGRQGYTNGVSLLEPSAARARVVSAWTEVGLWTDQGVFRVPRDSGADVSLWTRRWRLAPAQEEALSASRGELEALARECARFHLRSDGLLAAGIDG